MLELDLLLGHFMTRGFDNLTSEQVTHFEALLDYSDPEIYAWLMGFEAPDNPEILDLVATIRA